MGGRRRQAPGRLELIAEGEWAGWQRLWRRPVRGPRRALLLPRGRGRRGRLRLPRRAPHMNGGGFMHGGCLLTFADYALFIIGRERAGRHRLGDRLDERRVRRRRAARASLIEAPRRGGAGRRLDGLHARPGHHRRAAAAQLLGHREKDPAALEQPMTARSPSSTSRPSPWTAARRPQGVRDTLEVAKAGRAAWLQALLGGRAPFDPAPVQRLAGDR